MGCLKVLCLVQIVLSLLFGLIFIAVYNDWVPPTPADPPIVPDIWFGKGQRPPSAEDTSVKPFKIKVEQKLLDDLKKRITGDLERIVPPLEGSAFNYGFNSDAMIPVAEYWRDEYDWRKQEKVLNELPQFKTSIDGLDIHFVHVKPKKVAGKKVLPLLIVHGWPGSIVEFVKIIPELTSPRADSEFVFEVIAPSIPGYAWSSPPAQKGFNGAQCARVFRKLMRERLGHKTFYAHGGDWGSLITTALTTLYPESVRGLHITMPMFNNMSNMLKMMLQSWLPAGWIIDENELWKFLPMSTFFKETLLEFGYLHLQATKPDSVGHALSNSPVGLAAYILEKFSTWTNKANRDANDGNLTDKFTMDELLTNVMTYWVTNSITPSMRFYAENLAFTELDAEMERAAIRDVPVGLADFPQEIAHLPFQMAKAKFKNLVLTTDMEAGGHFAAFEEPEALAKELFKFVEIVERRKGEKAEKTEL